MKHIELDKEEEMVIVCATDDNFVQHCCIMLVSLLCHNNEVEIFIMTEGLMAENRKIIEEEVIKRRGIPHFCFVDSQLIEKMPLSKTRGLTHISRATYYRLLIAEILPKEIERAIYLDCDIVVNNSLSDLWELDLNDLAIAAVPQIGSGHEAERLGYPIEYGYFNAGVMLYNLRYCRENHITEVLMTYLNRHPNELKYNDQDVLNGALYAKCFHLLPQWNMTSIAYTPFLSHRGDSRCGLIVNDYSEYKANIKAYYRNPIVLHYVSKPKPWDKGCVHPLYEMYYYYASKTLHFNRLRPQPLFKRLPAIFVFIFRVYLSRMKQVFMKTDPSLM